MLSTKPEDAYGPSRHRSPDEALIVLTGITANRSNKSHVLDFYRRNTRYRVFLPNLCQYFGIRFASEQLCAFLKQHKLEDFKRCHFICYISGGFVLRCASALYPLPNLGRIVYLRSPLQERIPELSLQSYGRMLPLLLHGKIMFDLASDWKDNLPDIDAETGYVIEQGISKLARQLGLNSDDYRRYRNDPCFVIAEDRPSFNTPLSHDEVYSDDVLLEQMSRFVTSGAFPSA